MKTLAVTLAAIATAAAAAAPVVACGGEPAPENLVATPRVKAALASTYRAAHPSAEAAGPRRTYYGRFGGDAYAVSTFVRGGVLRTAIFLRHPESRWQLVKETRGRVCTDYVPGALVATWWFAPAGGRCFTPR